MSKRAQNCYWRCPGKKCLRNRAQAERIAKRQRRKHGHLIVAYWCAVCSAFHTGSQRGDTF